MIIGGFQKLTLLDYPNRLACIIFTKGCNFRCPYCHNSSLIQKDGCENQVSCDEVFSYLEKRRGMLEGAVISGGEPLLQDGLEEFLRTLSLVGYAIKLDTNGSFPERLKTLLDAGLVSYIAIDIKHAPSKYGMATGVCSETIWQGVRESLDLLKKSGIPYEVRTTAVKGIHDMADFEAIAKQVGEDSPYYLQNYVQSAGVLCAEGLVPFSDDERDQILQIVQKHCKKAAWR